MADARSYDVIIVGGGPAGSSCAIRLVRQGLKVALIEQKRFPRPKLCGEFISPECLDHFRELGVADQISTSDGVSVERTVFYARSGRSVEVPSEWFGSNAVGLSRAQMDLVLLERASDAGAVVLQEHTAKELLRTSDGAAKGVRATSPDKNVMEMKAALVIDATGRSRVLSRMANGHKPARADHVAFKAHLSGTRVPEGDCEIYSYPGGYGGCCAVEGGLYNLCFIIDAGAAKRHGSDAGRIMQELLFTNRRARRSLEHASVAAQWLAVPIEKYGRAELSPMPGVIAVGDAAGFIDPFTGSGILLALESSRIATGAVSESGLDDQAALRRIYEAKYQKAVNGRLGVSGLVRKAAFVPWLSGTVINCLSISKGLTQSLARATRAGFID